MAVVAPNDFGARALAPGSALNWPFGLIVASPLQRTGSLAEQALVPQAPPGNAHGAARPPAKTRGRAAGRPLPGRTWERVSAAFC
jgi:hypothetical protein